MTVSRWLRDPIETEKSADEFLAGLGKGLFVVAALQAVLGVLLSLRPIDFIGDALFCVVIGTFLPRTRSRALAVLLLIWALATTAVTTSALVGGLRRGQNVILAMLLTGLAARGVQATFKYHKLIGTRILWKHLAVVAALQAIGAVFAFIGFGISAGILQFALKRTWSNDTLGTYVWLAVLIAALGIHAASRRRFPIVQRPTRNAA